MSKPIQTARGEVHVCAHAVTRYIERVKPAFSYGHAVYELRQLLPQAEISDVCPAWLGENPEEETDYYLVLCESVAFPVHGPLVTTCMTRGSFGPVQREMRTKYTRWKRSHKRVKESKANSTGAKRQRKAQQAKHPRIDYGEAA